MLQVGVLVVVAVVAVAVAAVLARRTAPEPERGATYEAPTLVDRRHFERPDAPWLVVEFSSSTCLACRGTWEKVALLESEAVAVQDVDAVERKDLHDRYGIEAVPMTLVVDAAGLVQRSFIGPPSAADLWAAVAEAREPGSVPPGCDGDICGDAPADAPGRPADVPPS
ncbi:MAG: thioredoxin family protein [Acidimicrobiales bacterium]